MHRRREYGRIDSLTLENIIEDGGRMNTRKSMKRAAKQVLKRHYWFLVLVCLIASFLGTEFGNSLRLLEIYDISE